MIASELRAPTVRSVRRQRTVTGWLTGAILLLLGAIITFYAQITAPRLSGFALLIFIALLVAVAVRPLTGVYAMVFLVLISDTTTSPWFPFSKNLSSRESLLYISQGLTLSPLEILLAATFTFWVIGRIGTRQGRLVVGPMTWCILAFTVFVFLGFVNGLGTGGDIRVALFEGRALFMLLPMYLLVSNLCGPSELRKLMWTALCGIFLNAMLALRYLNGLSSAERAVLEDLGEHSAAILFNAFFVVLIGLFLYRGASRGARWTMLLLAVPVVMVYLAAQRRSAFVALAAAAIVLLLTLWWRERRKFLVLTPIVLVVTMGYTAAFWNSNSSAALPAQALKTVIAPQDVSEKDQSSDIYREIENFDINFTIRTNPLRGIGFGQAFLKPIALPDISGFEFHNYITHNSVLWIWMKTGFFGFAALLLIFAVAIRDGVTSLLAERDRTNAVIILGGLSYAIMYAVYAFVDIAWEPRGIIFLATCFSICAFRQKDRRVRARPVRSTAAPSVPAAAPALAADRRTEQPVGSQS